jgi:Tol biopolymer transport system component
VKTLAVAFLAATLAGGAGHSAGTPIIVFAADRAPSITGDVFRADANHRVVNLTHSPWQETTPTVSPNGKLVAFVSDRYGGSLWTVGTDGKGLRRLHAGGFPTQFAVEMVWSPNSSTLAYTTGGTVSNTVTLWLARPGGAARALAQKSSLFRPSWSPDGRLLTVETNGGAVQAFTVAGSRAWNVSSGFVPVGWSATGLFATGQYDGRIHVVDENGKERFAVPATTGAWSPDGTRLATMRGHRGEVWTSAGRLVSTRRYAVSDNQPTWTSATHVVFGPEPSVGPNTVKTGTTFAVRNGTRVYARVPGCDDDGGPVAAIEWLQPVPHSTSLVYQSYCPEPFHNLYSIAPDGTGLRRITNAQANQVKPSISPDRTRIAFGESQFAGMSCKGCPESLRTIGVDGTGATTLTSPPDCTFDDSPSWSPDGTQIIFVHSACDTAPGAYVIAAGGGTPTALNVPTWTVAWGPTRIAYANGQTDPASLWTALPDGTDRKKIAALPNLDSPAWSADGRLAYLDGTKVVVQGRKVQLPFAQVKSVALSPDGTRLVVAARPKDAPTFDVYTVKTDGTDVRRLTTNLDVSSADWR